MTGPEGTRESGAGAEILQLGDPGLRKRSLPVEDLDASAFRDAERRLHGTLRAFRAAYGFGRAVSAPQIGVAQRFIAANLGEGPFSIVNPVITWRSARTFTMWDDCMSFPSLLVRVRRRCSISVRFTRGDGVAVEWERLDPATSELLQHEIDHLDGVLAIDHALDRDAVVTRTAFDAHREHFRKRVDHVLARERGRRRGREPASSDRRVHRR